jgi:hypothetical protein
MFEIYSRVGGKNAALEIIASRGKRPTRAAVARWHAQRRIPAIAAVHLLDECIRRGIPAIYAETCVAPKEPTREAAE